jgi:excisionase family DNA binding protein
MRKRDFDSKVRRNRKHVHEESTVAEPLWTVEDVANYLRLRPETVRMMARSDKIPAIKVGRVWRFKGTDVRGILVANDTAKNSSIKSQ